MSNQPTVYAGKCHGGPLNDLLLTSGGPRRTFAKPVEPSRIDDTTPIQDTMTVTGYYDWSYTEHAWIWSDA